MHSFCSLECKTREWICSNLGFERWDQALKFVLQGVVAGVWGGSDDRLDCFFPKERAPGQLEAPVPGERLLSLPGAEEGWLKTEVTVCLHGSLSRPAARSRAPATSTPGGSGRVLAVALPAGLAPTNPLRFSKDLRTGCHTQAARSWVHSGVSPAGVNEAQGRWTSQESQTPASCRHVLPSNLGRRQRPSPARPSWPPH